VDAVASRGATHAEKLLAPAFVLKGAALLERRLESREGGVAIPGLASAASEASMTWRLDLEAKALKRARAMVESFCQARVGASVEALVDASAKV
jgi:hypothetical protein